MKYYRNFLVSLRFTLQLRWAAPTIWQWPLTFSSSMSFPHIQQVLIDRKFFSSFSIMIKFLLRCFFHYFFAVFILFKNCINKSISTIFTSINNNSLLNLLSTHRFVINTNKLVSKNARNVVLIFFCVKTFITINTF